VGEAMKKGAIKKANKKVEPKDEFGTTEENQ